ncbi:type II toxin-antitoxin system RelE/ParE family toxin [Rhodoferax sp.]|uniref:type II toxin-antitoxin system RelE/ParE family toxin n=1 Tax=Rhodoferax sp. TaxID=50421 RepID=UPI003BB741EF
MIESFKHKGPERFFADSDKRAIPAQSAARIERLLDLLEASIKADDMDLPGNKFHALKGNRAACPGHHTGAHGRTAGRVTGDAGAAAA